MRPVGSLKFGVCIMYNIHIYILQHEPVGSTIVYICLMLQGRLAYRRRNSKIHKIPPSPVSPPPFFIFSRFSQKSGFANPTSVIFFLHHGQFLDPYFPMGIFGQFPLHRSWPRIFYCWSPNETFSVFPGIAHILAPTGSWDPPQK